MENDDDKCNGKRRYASESHARKVRQAIYKARSPKLRIYFHDLCYSWHLTKEPRFER